MKMEPTASSETSAIRTQTPGNYPKRNKLQFQHPSPTRNFVTWHCFVGAPLSSWIIRVQNNWMIQFTHIWKPSRKKNVWSASSLLIPLISLQAEPHKKHSPVMLYTVFVKVQQTNDKHGLTSRTGHLLALNYADVCTRTKSQWRCLPPITVTCT